MDEKKYNMMLYIIDDYFEKEPLIISWENGLKVKCKSFTGLSETDTEPDDDDYIGEYSVGVNEVEILEYGCDDSVEIYNSSIDICLKCVPEKIMLENGTVLWQRDKGK